MTKRILFIVKNLYTMERLGAMQVSAQARTLGWETRLLIADNHSGPEILTRVRDYGPAIIAFSVMSPEYTAMAKLASQLHDVAGSFILFGGPHPTFFPDIVRLPYIQAVAFGEGDLSFPEFLTKFGDGAEFTGVPGMHFHLDGRIIQNPPAPLVEDLDRLPFADRRLISDSYPLLGHSRSHIFMASRGCPNACTYCFNHKYNQLFRGCGTLFRRRSVDHLIREIEEVRDTLTLEFAYIDDDIFTFCSPEWLAEFAGSYSRRVGVPFMVNVHVNFVDEEKIRLLRQAGCQVICFGIECGDQDVARTLLKRNASNPDYVRLSANLRQAGIRSITQNILALPVAHPLEVDLKTLDLNIRCRPDYAVAHIYYPLPGTTLEQYTRENGFFPADCTELPERTNSYSALNFPDRSEKIRVQRLHKLFGLVVSFPGLRPVLPMLIRLPLGFFYSLLFVLWYGFSMRFRIERTTKSRQEICFFIKSLWTSLASFLKRH